MRARPLEGRWQQFMLPAGIQVQFCRRLAAPIRTRPRDQSFRAPCTLAFEALRHDGTFPETCLLKPCKYLNNVREQDHRFVKRHVNPGMGFGTFDTAQRTIQGYEAMNIIHKGQITVTLPATTNSQDSRSGRILFETCIDDYMESCLWDEVAARPHRSETCYRCPIAARSPSEAYRKGARVGEACGVGWEN
jgi:hypothetical protein